MRGQARPRTTALGWGRGAAQVRAGTVRGGVSRRAGAASGAGGVRPGGRAQAPAGAAGAAAVRAQAA